MKCPVDNEMLVMTERSGVEIDYCPKCRGVWLDRGELDKIIERGSATAPQQPQQPAPPQYQSHPQQHPQQHYEHQKPYYKKRESFLSDLFDF
jgi:Zn-finger nucleic acid-binding protein